MGSGYRKSEYLEHMFSDDALSRILKYHFRALKTSSSLFSGSFAKKVSEYCTVPSLVSYLEPSKFSCFLIAKHMLSCCVRCAHTLCTFSDHVYSSFRIFYWNGPLVFLCPSLSDSNLFWIVACLTSALSLPGHLQISSFPIVIDCFFRLRSHCHDNSARAPSLYFSPLSVFLNASISLFLFSWLSICLMNRTLLKM